MVDASGTREKPITFSADDFKIEGLLEIAAGKQGVVISHPHPLHGGNMFNPVVETIQAAYRNCGYTTLRFNFRGVGKSRGVYEAGIGEQADVVGAVSYLTDLDLTQIDLVGYSFGTWVNAQTLDRGILIKNMIMVSPPVVFMDFSDISDLPCLKLVVTGDQDEIAPAEQVKRLLPEWHPKAEFEVITGADHFYIGYLKTLASVLSSHLEKH